MSVATFETSAPATTSSSSSGGGKKSNTTNILIGLLVVGALAYVGYKYIYLPAQERKRQQEDES